MLWVTFGGNLTFAHPDSLLSLQQKMLPVTQIPGGWMTDKCSRQDCMKCRKFG
jgi:hypothetical protein